MTRRSLFLGVAAALTSIGVKPKALTPTFVGGTSLSVKDVEDAMKAVTFTEHHFVFTGSPKQWKEVQHS